MGVPENRVAIVTGASSGIGRASARLFAQEGAKVVVAARRRNLLDELVGEISAQGGHAVAVDGDVRDELFARKLVETAVHRFGGLDIGFNNAGTIGAYGKITEISLADWEDTLRANVTSAFLGRILHPLVAHPATMTHAAMDPVACQTAGLVDGLLRLSVGIEALEDLQADLAAVLKRAEAVLPKHQREATAA